LDGVPFVGDMTDAQTFWVVPHLVCFENAGAMGALLGATLPADVFWADVVRRLKTNLQDVFSGQERSDIPHIYSLLASREFSHKAQSILSRHYVVPGANAEEQFRHPYIREKSLVHRISPVVNVSNLYLSLSFRFRFASLRISMSERPKKYSAVRITHM